MVEYVKLSDDGDQEAQKISEIAKLRKDVEFLKIMIFVFGVDLAFLTYIMLKMGGLI